jgi:hypothetical protein
MFPNAIGPGHDIENVRRPLHGKEPKSFVAGNFAAIDDTPGQFRNPGLAACVNQFSDHG